jgi:hypothetical protein
VDLDGVENEQIVAAVLGEVWQRIHLPDNHGSKGLTNESSGMFLSCIIAYEVFVPGYVY